MRPVVCCFWFSLAFSSPPSALQTAVIDWLKADRLRNEKRDLAARIIQVTLSARGSVFGMRFQDGSVITVPWMAVAK
jgi:hypothetical protein